MMDWMRDQYGQTYAPNTRETIRRYTLKQFVAAGLATENPGNPERPVNSPLWCYQVTDEALEVVRNFGKTGFSSALEHYRRDTPGLVDRYAEARRMYLLPVTLPDGKPFTLSPGGQNVLIRSMVEEFCPRYAPGGHVLYIGDAADKWALSRRTLWPTSA